MRRRHILILCLTASGLVAPAASQAAGHAGKANPPAPVVGAGTINVHRLAVRAAPSPQSKVVATLPQFRPQDYRPTTVLATKARPVRGGWYRIAVPGRPNGRMGWVRAADVDLRPMPWQVVVRLGSRQLELWRGTRLVHSARVAVGASGMETPVGLFYVTVRFKPVRQTFLGTFAFETSAFSKLSEWPGGGVVGLHGTWQPELLGRAVSHGCVRIANETANFLRDRIPVGTPIRILA
jgi:lipoprotein-anchoring transpeptidase ErfK/SrfK